MRTVTHFAVTVDGFAADSEGAPAILAAPEFDYGKTKLGFPEFRANLDAVAMGVRPSTLRRAMHGGCGRSLMCMSSPRIRCQRGSSPARS
jgi:hypothetical protein